MLESDARYASDFCWKLFMKYEYAILPKRSLLDELRSLPVISDKDENDSEDGESQKQT
jgi:hypothetical protein